MKSIYLLIAFISLSLNGYSQINTSEFGLNKIWAIVEWNKEESDFGPGIEEALVENNCSIFFNEKGVVFIYAGCNTITGFIKKHTTDSIYFSRLGITKINCVKQREVEKNLVHDFQLIRTYTINANEVIFILEDKTTIKAVAEIKQ